VQSYLVLLSIALSSMLQSSRGVGMGMGDWTTLPGMWNEGKNQIISDDKMIFESDCWLFDPRPFKGVGDLAS